MVMQFLVKPCTFCVRLSLSQLFNKALAVYAALTGHCTCRGYNLFQVWKALHRACSCVNVEWLMASYY